jgi:hypothetical protein
VSTQTESVELKDSETNTDYPDATSVEIQTVSSFFSLNSCKEDLRFNGR